MAEEFKTIKQVIEEWGKELVGDLGKSLPREVDASGDLRDSIKFQIKYFGTTYTFELSMLDYWKWVDQGRRPGKMPPIAPLIRWASEKKLAVRGDTKRLGAKRNTKKDVLLGDKARKSLAFAVARKIAREGTRPTNFYSKVVTPQRTKDLSRRLSVALKRDVQVYIQQEIL